jgi:uncharacterized Ntn-hydrolase superfamily protein
MTWSIIAREQDSGALGIAVASRFFAVGSLVPWIESGAGAIATQAMVNPTYGPNGLRMLSHGREAGTTLARLLAGDGGREARQLHIIDAGGSIAAHTGAECIEWCGHISAENISIAGNMLVGPEVLDASLAAYEHGTGLPVAERLLGALRAGDEAGGDKRGRQSAALLTYAGELYPQTDIRIDDHPDPFSELQRIFDVYHEDFAVFREFMPSAANPSGITDRRELEAARQAHLATRAAKQDG